MQQLARGSVQVRQPSRRTLPHCARTRRCRHSQPPAPTSCKGYGGKYPVCNAGGTFIETILLSYCNLVGTVRASACDLVNLSNFGVGTNRLSGTLPPCLSAWRSLTYLDLTENRFTGALPALPFATLGRKHACFLLDHMEGGTNAFDCPWPLGAVGNCSKTDEASGGFVNITDADCTAGGTWRCASGQCTGQGGSLSQQQCASMCAAPASRLFDCVSNKCVPAAGSGLPQALCEANCGLRARLSD